MESKIWRALALTAIALAAAAACGCNTLDQAFETLSNMDEIDADDQGLSSDDDEAYDFSGELPEYLAPESGTCQRRDRELTLQGLLQDNDAESCN